MIQTQPPIKWKLMGVEDLQVGDVVLSGNQTKIYIIKKIKGCLCGCREHRKPFAFKITVLSSYQNEWFNDFEGVTDSKTKNKRYVLRI